VLLTPSFFGLVIICDRFSNDGDIKFKPVKSYLVALGGGNHNVAIYMKS